MLNLDSRSAIPIWKQIEDEVRRLVAVGTLNQDGPVPSVRELAQQLRVNPATVSKAYQRLCDAGVLIVRRGEGTFVNASQPSMRRGEKRQALQRAADQFASQVVTIAATEQEARAAINEALARLDTETQKARRES